MSLRIAHSRAALQRAAQALLAVALDGAAANCTAGQTALQAALMLHWDDLKRTVSPSFSPQKCRLVCQCTSSIFFFADILSVIIGRRLLNPTRYGAFILLSSGIVSAGRESLRERPRVDLSACQFVYI